MILVASLGLAIGAVLGTLGAGGSVLTVPVLIYMLGLTPFAATTASLVVAFASSGSAIVQHARSGRVRWRTAAVLGVVGVVGTWAGAKLSVGLAPQTAELSFAALLLVVAVLMVRSSPPGTDAPRAGPDPAPRGGMARIAVTGVVLGLVTGFFGVGGGFLIVPALVLVLGFDAATAVGTSLAVIMLNSLSAFVARLGQPVDWDWRIVGVFLAAAVVGGAIGSRVAGSLSGPRLQRAFAVLLLAVAAYMAAQALTG